MGQDATTIAVNEPALSFEFDSSQSLFEQLTKAQQANTSSFSAHTAAAAAAAGYSTAAAAAATAAPPQMVRDNTDSMPPPQLPPVMPVVPEETTAAQSMYTSAAMTTNPVMVKPEQDYGQLHYDRNGMPISAASRIHQRHTSMPSYMEYSPAPSFVSSHYDDYGHRLSFEPVTPPQHTVALGAEPAYIANEDTGLWTAIPDLGTSAAFNPVMQLPPSNLAAPQFSTTTRSFPPSTNVYSVIEGSPTYKQRRRRSSIPPSITNAIAAVTGNTPTTTTQSNQSNQSNNSSNAHAAHRPSDLRRSVSSSVAPVPEGDESNNDSPPGLTNSYTSTIGHHKDLLQDPSRTGTPLPSLEESVSEDPLSLMHPQDELAPLPSADALDLSTRPPANAATSRLDRTGSGPGPVRRARSATMMELAPYPQKSHSCPIPSCGRLFKRLEHLKR